MSLNDCIGKTLKPWPILVDHYTQDKLALFAEIDRSYVGRIERGEVNITLEKLYELAETLGCDVRELLP